MPSLEEGIQFVGFLKDLETSNTNEDINYIISDHSGTIHGITKGCYELLGIPLGIVHENTQHITLQAIAPDLFNPELQDDLKNATTVIFDTTILHSYFNYYDSDIKTLEQYEN
eukprot:CAMPEP_0201283110 /NCGR_PEP_ID=MMETSP1317-20130820/7644_1 /ASSEMBLY_ACC=CAM_ASM_000770 /TAXON_ID=187299 /ORGANISM="Undescribed Undescribed, Strain Undescribed" /LENGTH=112 /DNA_ID=CAMNT_0047598203 /DNA_START=65 /DNA_END=403 /DNA_ORIENTATION=+